MGVFEITAMLVIGLFAGVTGGLLGIGGSIVMIPAMTMVLGPNQHLYQAAAMIVNFFVVVPAVRQHARAKVISLATVWRLIPLALAGVVLGVGISEIPLFRGGGEAYLRGLFGLFLLCLCVFEMYRLSASTPSNSENTPMQRKGLAQAAGVALPTGIIAGLLGVGGGVLAVPLQRRFFGSPIRTAIANSAAIIIVTSLAGAILKNIVYVRIHSSNAGSAYAPIFLACCLIPTAMIGSTAGSKLTHILPVRIVKTCFVIILAIASVRLIGGAWSDLPA